MKQVLKLTVSIVLFLFTMSVAVAQKHIEKTKIVCDTDVLPIKLGENVMGINLDPSGGTWQEVDALDNTKIIDKDASEVFVALDRQPGKYVFIYTAHNNVCMAKGDTAKAIVIVRETPKPIHINVALCPGESTTIKLKDYISPKFTTVAFTDDKGGAITNGDLVIPANFEGEGTASYKVTMTPTSTCNSEALITYNVTRDGTVSTKDLTGSKLLCITALPDKMNLNNELGLAGNGSWTAEGVAPNITNGVITFPQSVTTGTYTYKYTFSGGTCGLAGTVATYTLTIADDLSTQFKDGDINVCKIRNPKRKVDMMSALNINVPVASGKWKAEAGNPQEVSITDGFFEVENAIPGTYKYRFKISDASDLCGLGGKEAVLSLILDKGGRLKDGEVQVCSTGASNSFDLSKHISGIKGKTVTWYDAKGTTEITGGKIDASKLDVGTYKYVYKTSVNDCPYEGSLYVAIIKDKEITNFVDKEIAYCYDDEGADAIDLDEVLSVAGITGTWTTTVTGPNYDANTHVFNGKAEAQKTGVYPQTYSFTFTADSKAGCGLAGKSVTIKVKITDTLIP